MVSGLDRFAGMIFPEFIINPAPTRIPQMGHVSLPGFNGHN